MFDLGAHDGKKRSFDEELEGEQRLTKRLNKLNLDHHHHVAPQQPNAGPSQPRASEPEPMYVDETKDRVYIHDLAAEIAEIEEAEQHKKLPAVQFLPEIEKTLAAFPLLQSQAILPADGQLVLYKQVSFSEEFQTEQRKVILEERRRAQEQHAQQAQEEQEHQKAQYNTISIDLSQPEDDPDAMDVD